MFTYSQILDIQKFSVSLVNNRDKLSVNHKTNVTEYTPCSAYDYNKRNSYHILRTIRRTLIFNNNIANLLSIDYNCYIIYLFQISLTNTQKQQTAQINIY